jgi:oligoribonuclease
LTAESLASKESTQAVEQDLLDYLTKYVPRGEGYMVGSCVYVDREFMRIQFPRVIDYLHWRLLGPAPLIVKLTKQDVGTIRVLSASWAPGLNRGSPPRKEKDHRAMADIKYSIEELKYYKEAMWTLVDNS